MSSIMISEAMQVMYGLMIEGIQLLSTVSNIAYKTKHPLLFLALGFILQLEML